MRKRFGFYHRILILFIIAIFGIVLFLNLKHGDFTITGNIPYDLSSATYDNVNISSQDSNPMGLFFKPDGTKLYEIGLVGDKVYQSTCSDAWNLSSCTYDNVNISTQDINPSGLFFKPDGTRLYEVGYNNDLIYQSTCSDAWNLSSCTYDNVNISTQDLVPIGLFFKLDGTKLYEAGNNAANLYQYTCSDAWNLSSCNFDNGISSQATPHDLVFKSDGTKLYELGSVNIYQHTCSDAWNLSSCNFDNINIATQDGNSEGLFLKPDGTRLYEIGNANNLIYQYSFSVISVDLLSPENNINYSTSPITVNFSTNITRSSISLGVVNVSLLINDVVNQTIEHAWNLSSAVWDGPDTNLSVTSQDTDPLGLVFKPDGTKLYVLGFANDRVYQYSLLDPWNLSSAVWDGSDSNLSVTSQDTDPLGLVFKPDGTKLYVVGFANEKVYQYSLLDPWNVSNASWDGSDSNLSVSSQDTTPYGLVFKPDGTKLYVIGVTNEKVYQYSLLDPWNVSNASWDGSDSNLSVSSQDTSPFDLAFKPDGTKLYVMGSNNHRVYQYSILDPWNVSNASWDDSDLSVSSQDTAPYGLAFKPDGTKLYIVGGSNDRVYQYSLFNETIHNFSATFSVDGNYNWSIQSYDGNNYPYNSTTNFFTIDTTAPTATFLPETTSGNKSQDYIYANYTANDVTIGLDKIVIYIYNSTSLVNSTILSSSPALINFTTLPDGTYYLNATANDTLGNQNQTETRKIILDTTPPTITFSCDSNLLTQGDTLTCTCTATDSGLGIDSTTYTINPSTSTTGSFSTSCTSKDKVNNSATATLDYTVLSSGGSPSTPSAGSPTLTKTSLLINVESGETTITTFENTGIKEISIIINQQVQIIRIHVSKYDSKPTGVSIEVSGKTYRYLEINAENLNENLETATVKFEVEKSWLTENNLNTNEVSVFKFDNSSNKWNELKTTFENEDNGNYIYSIEVDSFSFFAIAEKPSIISDIIDAVTDSYEEVSQSKLGLVLWWLIFMLLLVGIVIIVILIMTKIRSEN